MTSRRKQHRVMVTKVFLATTLFFAFCYYRYFVDELDYIRILVRHTDLDWLTKPVIAWLKRIINFTLALIIVLCSVHLIHHWLTRDNDNRTNE